MAKDSTNTGSTVAPGSETLPPPIDHLSSEMSTPPAAHRQAGMSLAENRDTDEAVTTTTNTTRFTVVTGSGNLSPLTVHLPSSPMLPAADRRAGISPAENALHDANEAMTTINLSKTWEGALERIKWVMDTLSPVAEVRQCPFCQSLFTEFHPQLSPYAKMAHGLLFAIPKVACLRYCHIEILMLCFFGC